MPRPVLNFGLKLVAQQLWCWGQDIEHPDSNLLMDYGFERHRSSDDPDRSTCYRLDDGTTHVCMWGFGMFFGQRDFGGLYLGRLDFTPRWAPIESLSMAIHWPADLPMFFRPSGRSQWHRARSLWQSQLQWIANYEHWVKATAGLAYRRSCVASWMRPLVRAERMAAAWQFLSRRSWEQSSHSVASSLREFTIAASNS